MKVKYVKPKHQKQRVREACTCMARRHPLFANCTACGKIICELEGEGPCFFCGSFVTKDNTIISDDFEKVTPSSAYAMKEE